MKLKISFAKNPSHKSSVTCLGWSSSEEVYSAGDDNQLFVWSVSTNESSKLTHFSEDLCPTNMQFLPRNGVNSSKHTDIILLTSADGKFYIMNKSGRIERVVRAHNGAVLVGQWDHNGIGLLTGGEDGCIKIWSRNGMLRSVMVTSDNPIFGACWSPDNQSIVYTHGKYLIIKPLTPNLKPVKWKAHDGLILSLSWSSATDYIVSGGEDCKYKLWNSQGQLIFSSGLHDSHITAVAWAPDGNLLAIGSSNTLRLCDSLGWSRSLEKLSIGSIYKLAWSNDGTQLAAASAHGHVVFAQVIERHVHYLNYTASVTEPRTMTVRNLTEDTTEQLELPERIIQIAMKYDHLVVTTPTQCYIYNVNNWNTPAIIDLKDGAVTLLTLCEKHFLLVEKNSASIYNYQGKLIASPRWPNMRPESVKIWHISLSTDTLAVRDLFDTKVIHIYELNSNRSTSESTRSIEHSMPIIQIALNQSGPFSARNLALLDNAKDLYLVPLSTSSSSPTFTKLSRKIDCFQWNYKYNMLAASQDTRLIVWFCPVSVFSSSLLKCCSVSYDAMELGKTPKISDFVENSVTIRKIDGSVVEIFVSPFPLVLHRYIQEDNWNEALHLCRDMDDKVLWGCLAALSIQLLNENMDITEEALARINHFDKVFYIKYAKALPSKVHQKSTIALLGGSLHVAESILLHNGLVFPAIYNNIQLHNWLRALDLAAKYKSHTETVLYMRQQYLNTLGKEEICKKFSAIKEKVPVDPKVVEEKIKEEIQKLKPKILT